MITIGINGFGRIGRTLLRTILQDKLSPEKIKVNAINLGPGNPECTGHLFKYDTIMGTYHDDVFMENNILKIGNHSIKIIAECDPKKINWKELDVELVAECSGKFTDAKLAKQHIESGAKYVLISAPAKNEDITIIPGVNEKMFDKNKHKIISLGSCTTNALVPLLKVIHDEFTITSAYMLTAHAYTNSQVLLDVEKKDLRRSRAAGLNIIPTTTGAAKVAIKIIPELENIFSASAIRVPIGIVSFLDLSFTSKQDISAEAINKSLEKAKKSYLKGFLDITCEPLVSSDFKGNPHSVIVDGLLTNTANKIGKIFGWYDNEWGYSCRLRDFINLLS